MAEAKLRNLPLTVHTVDEDAEPIEVLAIAPDIIRWERATNQAVSKFAEQVALADLARIAWHALRRLGHPEVADYPKPDRWVDERVAWVDDGEPDEVDPTPPGP